MLAWIKTHVFVLLLFFTALFWSNYKWMRRVSREQSGNTSWTGHQLVTGLCLGVSHQSICLNQEERRSEANLLLNAVPIYNASLRNHENMCEHDASHRNHGTLTPSDQAGNCHAHTWPEHGHWLRLAKWTFFRDFVYWTNLVCQFISVFPLMAYHIYYICCLLS